MPGKPGIPGIPIPPAILPIRSRSSSLLREIASLTAVITRSWSISTSSGSTADGSISTLRTSWAPVITSRTAPPPAVASRVVSASSCCACAICACICCAILAIWPMFTKAGPRCGWEGERRASTHLGCVDELAAGDLEYALEEGLRLRIVGCRADRLLNGERLELEVVGDAFDGERSAERLGE